MATPILSRKADLVYITYFVAHIFVIICEYSPFPELKN